MSVFENIDSKLVDLSNKIGGKLTKDRPSYPESLRTFEERRIDWIDKTINKAIIIQPTFEEKGVNSKIWNFIIIAWFDNAKSTIRPKWISNLVEREKFEMIEENIDKLLQDSEDKLTKITMTDLK